MRAAPAVVPLLLLAACAPEHGPLMAPGEDCLACHDGADAERWTAAGTWTPGAHVTMSDSAGRTLTLRGNRVGNFYTAEPLSLPLSVTVNGKRMPEAVTYAGCNRCHGFGRGLETGPLMAPGQDCLLCHDGRSATRWSVAGTWGGPGARVTLTDSTGKTLTLATNQVGNFYTAEPLRFPLTVTVGSARMPDRVTYGGCNDCHGAGGSGGD